MTDSEQELADAIEQLTQHIQVLYETIEDLKSEVQWANNNRYPQTDWSEQDGSTIVEKASRSGKEKIQGGLF